MAKMADTFHHLPPACTPGVRTLLTHNPGLQAQAASLRRITQGGLNEASAVGAEGLEGALGEAGRRDREAVSTVDIVRHPSEAEQILRMLPAQLRTLKTLRPTAGEPFLPLLTQHQPKCLDVVRT